MIETLRGPINAENAHLLAITEPDVSVTPNDEHEGAATRSANTAHRAHHRGTTNTHLQC
ncbi:MAG: hypothetical protein ACKV2O_16845 [Acidimicrobiales bacterium]